VGGQCIAHVVNKLISCDVPKSIYAAKAGTAGFSAKAIQSHRFGEMFSAASRAS
jgi:hypothetical protein